MGKLSNRRNRERGALLANLGMMESRLRILAERTKHDYICMTQCVEMAHMLIRMREIVLSGENDMQSNIKAEIDSINELFKVD